MNRRDANEQAHKNVKLRTDFGNMDIHLEKLPLFDGKDSVPLSGPRGMESGENLFTAKSHNTTWIPAASIRCTR